MRIALVLTALVLTGCELLEDAASAAETAEPPTAEFNRAELVERPTNNQLASWFCSDLSPDLPILDEDAACEAAFGRIPQKTDLKFSFDIVFDLGNPNGFPIPLVEILLALDVFEGAEQAELGAVCVSFCNPEDGTCPDNPEEACRPADNEIRSLEDLVPTVDDLVEIAHRAATGELFEDENLQFRFIPGREEDCGEEICPPGSLEAHLRFDLGLDATLKVLEVVATDAVDALLTGDSPSFDIPWSMLGTLFFDVPVLGRFGIEFGPVTGVFSLD
jgi:hypothetical protein